MRRFCGLPYVKETVNDELTQKVSNGPLLRTFRKARNPSFDLSFHHRALPAS